MIFLEKITPRRIGFGLLLLLCSYHHLQASSNSIPQNANNPFADWMIHPIQYLKRAASYKAILGGIACLLVLGLACYSLRRGTVPPKNRKNSDGDYHPFEPLEPLKPVQQEPKQNDQWDA